MSHQPRPRLLHFVIFIALLAMCSGCEEFQIVFKDELTPGEYHGVMTAANLVAGLKGEEDANANSNATATADDVTILAGDVGNDGAATRTGIVHVFEPSRSGWQSTSRFFDANGTGRQGFGQSIASKGTDAIVGAPLANSNAGRAFVFTANGTTFQQQGTLIASDAAANDGFGTTVSIDGNVAIVGSPFRGNTNTGAAYVFNRVGSTWSPGPILTLASPAANDIFGIALLLEGNEALISSFDPNAFPFPSNGGRVHVWTNNAGTWTEGPTLRPNDASTGKGFGSALARSGNWLVVGATGDSQGTQNAGAAYVFERVSNNWVQRQKLLASDPIAGAQYGGAVATDGNWIVVGAPNANGKTAKSGAAYVYQLSGNTWQFAGKLFASDGVTNDAFGRCVGVLGSLAVVGAPDATVDGFVFAGKGYVFTIPDYFDAQTNRTLLNRAQRAIFRR
jgi:hypothetical protein